MPVLGKIRSSLKAAAALAAAVISAEVLASAALTPLRIEVPEAVMPELSGRAGTEFARSKGRDVRPSGKKLDFSFGSAAGLAERESGGTYRLLTATDEGPVCAGPARNPGRSEFTRVYLSPDYAPKFVDLRLFPAEARLQVIQVRSADKNGETYRGLPAKTARSLSVDYREEPVSLDMKHLEDRSPSINPRGVVAEPDGTVWVADSSLPSIVRLSNRFSEVSRAVPGKGLPRMLAWSAFDRGFNGLAKLPDGRLATVLYPEQKAEYAVILLTRPADWSSNAMIYPKPADLESFSVSGISGAGKGKLLGIEQGFTASGRFRSRLVEITLDGASDLTEHSFEGGLEGISLKEFRKRKLRMAKRRQIADLGSLGIDRRIEAAVFLDGRRAVLFSNPGYGVKCEAGGVPLSECTLSRGRLTMKDGSAAPSATVKATGETTKAWLLTLGRPAF